MFKFHRDSSDEAYSDEDRSDEESQYSDVGFVEPDTKVKVKVEFEVEKRSRKATTSYTTWPTYQKPPSGVKEPWAVIKKHGNGIPPKPVPKRLTPTNHMDLNVRWNYGAVTKGWGASASVREIVCNMFDGVIEYHSHVLGRGMQCTPEDFTVRATRKVYNTKTWSEEKERPVAPGESINDANGRDTWTFFLYSKSAPARGSKPLAWVSIRFQQYRDRCDIEVWNWTPRALDFGCLAFGGTTKEGDDTSIGQFGEGLKMAVAALLRLKHCRPPVMLTGNSQWDFGYDDEQYIMVYAKTPKGKSTKIPGVLFHIYDFPTKDLSLWKYLFLSPPQKTLAAKDGEKGWILLDPDLLGRIFVKHVWLQDRRTPEHGLHYGINFKYDIGIGRDRSAALDDDDMRAEVYKVWSHVFNENEEPLDLFVNLALEHENAMEVANLGSNMTQVHGKKIFDHLRKKKGNNQFFYFATDTADTIRIIEGFLKMVACPIPKTLYDALIQHEVICSPQEARRRRFMHLKPSGRYTESASFIQHTHHLVEAFLDLESETLAQKIDYTFKETPDDAVEIVSDETEDGVRIYMGENVLSPSYVHKKSAFGVCVQNTSQNQTLELFSNDLPPCDCPALHILDLMVHEVPKLGSEVKRTFGHKSHMVLKTIPRNLSVTLETDKDSTLVPILRWHIDGGIEGFLVVVKEATSHAEVFENLLVNRDYKKQEQTSALTHVLTSGSNELRLPFAQPAKRYFLQVSQDRPNSEAPTLFSAPLEWTWPPVAPRSVSAIWLSKETLLIELDSPKHSDDVHRLQIFWDGVKHHESDVAANETNWELTPGLEFPSETDIQLRIYAAATALGVLSQEFACCILKPWKAPTPGEEHGGAMQVDEPQLLQDDDEDIGDIFMQLQSAASDSDSVENGGGDSDDEYANEKDEVDDSDYIDDETDENKDQGDKDYEFDDDEVDDLYAGLIIAPPSQQPKELTEVIVHGITVRPNSFYEVTLKGVKSNAMSAHKSIFRVWKIEQHNNKTGLLVSRYVFWHALYTNADERALLLLYNNKEEAGLEADAESYDISALEHVEEAAFDHMRHTRYSLKHASFFDYHHPVVVGALKYEPGNFHRMSLIPLNEDLVDDGEEYSDGSSIDLSSFSIADIFSGVGGSTCGFKKQGFEPVFAVEKDYYAAAAYQRNCSGAQVHVESVANFLQAATKFFNEPLSVLLASPPCQGFSSANPGGNQDAQNRAFVDIVPKATKKLKPAYLFYENAPAQASAKDIQSLRKLEYDLVALGYSVQRELTMASDYGVPSHRRRLTLVATRHGHSLPEFPSPTHGDKYGTKAVTLGDVIADLEWKNSWCRSTQEGHGSYVMKHDKCWANHCTGCRMPDFEKWDPDRTIPDWNEPICTIRTQSSDRWACRHPRHPERLLTVRELARASSFPDEWEFFGPLQSQYRQVGNAVPPKLAEAWAKEIMKVIEQDQANHRGAESDDSNIYASPSPHKAVQANHYAGSEADDSDIYASPRPHKRQRLG